MQDQSNPCPQHGSTAREDEQAQRAVLSLLLGEHPAQLTVFEVAREMSQDEDEDSVERAIRDLVGIGLLRCEGTSVLPTRAALHFDRLDI